MALITGSSTTDWSTISLSQVDFAAHIVQASNRSDQIGAELISGNWFLVSASPTRIVVDLFSGGRIAIGGSGFNTSNPIVRSVSFFNTATGEILRYTGFSNGVGNGSLTSLTYGTTSFAESFIGNVTTFENDPNNQNDDTYAGPVTSLTARIGAATVTLSGTFNLTGDDVTAALTGTVTGIVVASGTNSIKMTGLSVDIDVLEAAFASNALSTVSDLFSVVGNQLNGDDLITYTNNSGVGMSFFGGAGNDTININGLRGDTLNGGAGNDTLAGGLGQDTVNGGDGNDTITMLVTAGNVDTIDAGDGTDTLVLSGVVGGTGLVVVDLSAADQVASIAGDPNRDNQIQTGFEGVNGALLGSAMTVTGSDGDNVIIGSNGADTIDGGDGQDTLLGGAGNDTLIGGLGNDVLNGGTGNDTMTGGAGDDTYVIDSLLDVINEAAGDANDTVQINRSVDLTQAPFTEIEHVVLTGAAALNATGDAGNNQLTGNSGANILNGGDGNDTLTGNAGNDTLNGGAGDDAMDGGAGNDTYVVDSAGDTVTESLAGAAGGVDVVQSAVTFSLATLGNVEHLTLTGTDDINGTGNGLANTLTGNSGDNVLTGGAGNDRLIGNAGNDTLDGGAGVDTMIGGLGDDTYVRDAATDVITEGLNAGTDTVQSSLNYTLAANLENLELTGAALTGTGNTLNNIITGTSGNNTLTGLAGNDTLNGGDGNDILNGGLGVDHIQGGAGNDLILLGSTLEFAIGETIDGGADTDTLRYTGAAAGTVTLTDLVSNIEQVQIANAAGLTTGVAAINVNASAVTSNGLTLTGNNGANILTGTGLDDSLIGNAGNDILNGGGGNDTLNGGLGNDTFIFALGDGQDLVQDNSGTADRVLFQSGINPLDLIISQQASDLRIAIEGTTDQITVQNWYDSAANRTETIQAGNGQVLLSTQVETLIQAMAAFTTNTGVTWDQAAAGQGDQTQYQAIIAANWQSFGS